MGSLWLFYIKCLLSRITKPSVSDDEFSRHLRALLSMLVMESELTGVIENSNDSDILLRETVALLRRHLCSYEAHYKLMDVRPRRKHWKLHSLVKATSNGYIKTLGARTTCLSMLTVPWNADDRGVRRQHFRSRDDARGWDKFTHRCAVLLVSAIRGSSLEIEIPEGLVHIADEDTANLFGSVIPDGGELTSQDRESR